MADAPQRAQILCVDDDPVALEQLDLVLGRRFTVLMAPSGADALELLAGSPDVAVVIADLRMPRMDGLTLLREVRRAAPFATRILLTDCPDVGSFLGAINEAEVFRVLMKPVTMPPLVAAVDAAIQRWRQVVGERVRFATGMRDGLAVLVEVLANSSPVAFGRALRLRDTVVRVAVRLGSGDLWSLELAALLASIGYFALPREVLGKLERDEPLSGDEQGLIDGAPRIAERLLQRVPGLEVVRSILATASDAGPAPWPPPWPEDDARGLEPLLQRRAVHGGHILRLAVDFDALEQRHGTRTALEVIRAKAASYDEQAVDALAAVFGEGAAVRRDLVREVPASELDLGMVIVEEVRTLEGALFARRGQPVTPAFLERLQNARPGSLREPLRVVTWSAGEAAIRLP